VEDRKHPGPVLPTTKIIRYKLEEHELAHPRDAAVTLLLFDGEVGLQTGIPD